MDNLETISDTQDTGRRQTKQKTQHRTKNVKTYNRTKCWTPQYATKHK